MSAPSLGVLATFIAYRIVLSSSITTVHDPIALRGFAHVTKQGMQIGQVG